MVHKLKSLYAHSDLVADSPGGIGGGDEEVDGHPVTHVETLLHLPARQQRNKRKGLSCELFHIKSRINSELK